MSYQASAGIRDGKLAPVLNPHAPPPVPVQVVHRSQRSQPLKQRAFIDFVAPRLKMALDDVESLYG
jgi:DNA-binding transcriptional LysR family regulator